MPLIGSPTVLRISNPLLFRFGILRTPQIMFGRKYCGQEQRCFHLNIPLNHTMLQAYNCDRQKPGEKLRQMPAEKQIYRPDFVMHHFIHYSTVTESSNMNKEDLEKAGRKWNGWSAFPDQLARFGDERTEGMHSGILPQCLLGLVLTFLSSFLSLC